VRAGFEPRQPLGAELRKPLRRGGRGGRRQRRKGSAAAAAREGSELVLELVDGAVQAQAVQRADGKFVERRVLVVAFAACHLHLGGVPSRAAPQPQPTTTKARISNEPTPPIGK
jgi:hypothetical protein